MAVTSTETIIAAVLPVYILMLAGALLRKVRLIRPEHDEGVMRVVFSVMLPCFILDKILGAEVLRCGWVVMGTLGLGYGLILFSILIGLGMGRLLGLERGMGLRTFALSSGCQNFSFTATPVVEILWGAGALPLLFVHNIGVEVCIWSVGAIMMSGRRTMAWRRLISGPVVAVTIGLTLVAMGLDDDVTGLGRKSLSMIGVGCFPLAILITGCAMIDQVGAEKVQWRMMSGAVLIRLVICPAVILCMAKFLPMPTALRQVMVVQAAMPAGVSTIILAKLYGGRPAVAVQVVVATTVISLLTLPYIIKWGSAWIGLKPLLP